MAKRGNRFGQGVNGKHILIGIVVLVLIGLIVWACVYDPANLFGNLQTDGTGANAWMGENDWILQIKLGVGGENCKSADGVYSCRYLYASSTEPQLKLITKTTADQPVSTNPSYQFYQSAQNHDFVSWNDQGAAIGGDPHTCTGNTGAAHDKGSVVYDANGGVYLQSSNPQWGFWNQGFLNSCDIDGGECLKHAATRDDPHRTSPIHPGLQTNLAQHMLFVKIPSASDLASMAELMSNANLCQIEGSLPGFTPCSGSCPKNRDYMQKDIGKVSIIAKPRGTETTDVWAYLNQKECGSGGIHVMSFCIPPCPGDAPGVTDVHNARNSVSSIMNTDCGLPADANDAKGNPLKIHSFKQNHSKIGVCDSPSSDTVIIGGNNHAPHSQGPRGGLFVVIKNNDLANTFRCLFKDPS